MVTVFHLVVLVIGLDDGKTDLGPGRERRCGILSVQQNFVTPATAIVQRVNNSETTISLFPQGDNNFGFVQPASVRGTLNLKKTIY